MLARFPVTTVLLLEYGLLVIFPAFTHNNPQLGFITGLVLLAVAVVFGVELLLAPMKERQGREWSWVTPRASIAVLSVGLGALLISPLIGVGTYGTQIGQQSRSHIGVLVTPFQPWALIGAALILHCYRKNTLSRKASTRWLIVAVIVHLVYSIQLAITGPFAAFTFAILVMSVIYGLVRPRVLFVAMLLGFLIWPTIFAYRNSVRLQQGASGIYGQEATASARLREDLLLEQAGRLKAIHVGQPSLLTTARFGLIPRALDPGRAELATGKLLSPALGIPRTSSSTLTMLGNVFSLGGGRPAVVIVLGGIATAMAFLVRRRGPFAAVVTFAILVHMLWIEVEWPDSMAGVLQTVVSTMFAFLAVRLFTAMDDALARTVKHRAIQTGRSKLLHEL